MSILTSKVKTTASIAEQVAQETIERRRDVIRIAREMEAGTPTDLNYALNVADPSTLKILGRAIHNERVALDASSQPRPSQSEIEAAFAAISRAEKQRDVEIKEAHHRYNLVVQKHRDLSSVSRAHAANASKAEATRLAIKNYEESGDLDLLKREAEEFTPVKAIVFDGFATRAKGR